MSLERALAYHELGFALVPIGPREKDPYWDLLPTNPRTGRPMWRPFAENPATEKQIREWFDRDPECNIGVICGEPSNNLVVADFDVKPPKDISLPLTPMVKTGRGLHLYFRTAKLPKSHVMTKSGMNIGEIRANGNYVVLPPSVHPSGVRYEWLDSLSPLDVGFAELPEWAADALIHTPHTREREASNEYALLASPPGSVSGGIDGHTLTELTATPGFALQAAGILGIPAECATEKGMGGTFRCVLPGHSETTPSASLCRGNNGVVMYRDWHQRDGREWYFLAEVRASRAYGRVVTLSDPGRGRYSSELAVWTQRLLVETGLLRPADVPMRELPKGVTPCVRKVYEGFRLLLGCKWLYRPGEPTTFAWRFASAWCGVSERHAGDAIQELMRLGIIYRAGSHICRGRPIALFLPVAERT